MNLVHTPQKCSYVHIKQCEHTSHTNTWQVRQIWTLPFQLQFSFMKIWTKYQQLFPWKKKVRTECIKKKRKMLLHHMTCSSHYILNNRVIQLVYPWYPSDMLSYSFTIILDFSCLHIPLGLQIYFLYHENMTVLVQNHFIISLSPF